MEALNKITVTDIKEMFTVFSPKGRRGTITDRASYGISFCSEGAITYTLNGKCTVSDCEHAVILPKAQSYTLYGNKSGSFPVINFDCKDFLCDEVIALPIQNENSYVQAYEKMKALSIFEKNRAEIMSIFYNILHRLSGECQKNDMLRPAIKIIEEEYQNPELSNGMLAEKCNISEIYFRKKFADTYKTTPKQFIIDVRISKAKQLLADDCIKIGAVAEQCGFSNQYHFCRLFKEKTGLTPSEYINQNRNYKI